MGARLVKRRVYVSSTTSATLSAGQRGLKDAVLAQLSHSGFGAETFDAPTASAELTAARRWSPESVDQVVRRCQGAVLIGFPRWTADSAGGPVRLLTEYNHYDGAVATTLGLPTLILAHEDLAARGIIAAPSGVVATFPRTADRSWVTGPQFASSYGRWLQAMSERRDVFLGYCSRAKETAAEVKELVQQAGATVLDWASDFAVGGNILDQVHRAAALCSAGVFLFTNDDPLSGAADRAAPRDNVVFEAGYFMSAKGSARVAIIREAGSKLPADLGGNIYLDLPDRKAVPALGPALRRFLSDL